jgi:hypothetical protein
MDDRLVCGKTGDANVEEASEEQANEETDDLEEGAGGHA